MVLEKISDLIGGLREIYDDVISVLLCGKFSYHGGFSHTSGTLYHQGISVAGFILPFQQIPVDLSFEDGAVIHAGSLDVQYMNIHLWQLRPPIASGGNPFLGIQDVTIHILSKRTGMHTSVHAIKLEEVTIRLIPPNAGPFPAISAKPYLNSCCRRSIVRTDYNDCPLDSLGIMSVVSPCGYVMSPVG